MPKRVIDILKIVAIKEQDGELVLRFALSAVYTFLNPFDEEGAIHEAGECVVCGGVSQLCFGDLPLGDLTAKNAGAFGDHLLEFVESKRGLSRKIPLGGEPVGELEHFGVVASH